MFIPLHDTNAHEHISRPWVTWAIIAINIVLWLVTGFDADQADLARTAVSYGYIPSVINDIRELPPDLIVFPEQASYITYAFFHGDFMHLAGNMAFLWVFADNVEDAMGHVRFILFFFACAAFAAFVHGLVFAESDSPLIGASGAAAGAVAAYLMLHPNVRVWVLAFGRLPLRLPAVWVLGAWIAFQVAMFLFSTDQQVSWAAHVGGIIAGAILVLVLRRRGVALFDREPAPAAPAAPAPAGAEQRTRWGRGE